VERRPDVLTYTTGPLASPVEISGPSSLRLQVASSNFPHWDRNMNTGHPVGTDAAGVTARQSVYHAGTLASYLELPMGGFRE
jgi:predicted acyl esterase